MTDRSKRRACRQHDSVSSAEIGPGAGNVEFAGTVSKAWMAEALGVRFDRDYYFDPRRRHAVDARCNAYLAEHFADLGLLFTESNLGRLAHYAPRQVLVGGIQPNMILGMLVGAEFMPNDRMDADISPTPLAGVDPHELPSPESLLKHDVVRLLEDQFLTIRREGELDPVPPFFWDASGRAAVHGPLTTAQKLLGESIFLDLAANGDRAAAILDWAADVSIGLVEHYARLADRRVDEIHVGECSACMIGIEPFERFVVPAVSRFGRESASVRFHTCGTSDHLLPACRGIENLGSLDVGGGTSVRAIRERFGREMPVDIAPLVDDLLAAAADPLLNWGDRVLAQNDGGPLRIVFHLEEGYDLEHLRTLQRRVVPDTC